LTYATENSNTFNTEEALLMKAARVKDLIYPKSN